MVITKHSKLCFVSDLDEDIFSMERFTRFAGGGALTVIDSSNVSDEKIDSALVCCRLAPLTTPRKVFPSNSWPSSQHTQRDFLYNMRLWPSGLGSTMCAVICCSDMHNNKHTWSQKQGKNNNTEGSSMDSELGITVTILSVVHGSVYQLSAPGRSTSHGRLQQTNGPLRL